MVAVKNYKSPPFFLIIFLNYNQSYFPKVQIYLSNTYIFSIVPPTQKPQFPHAPGMAGNNKNMEAEFNQHADSLIG